MNNSEPYLQTVFGTVRGDYLYLVRSKEKITYNYLQRDVDATYILIKRFKDKLYIVDKY